MIPWDSRYSSFLLAVHNPSSAGWSQKMVKNTRSGTLTEGSPSTWLSGCCQSCPGGIFQTWSCFVITHSPPHFIHSLLRKLNEPTPFPGRPWEESFLWFVFGALSGISRCLLPSLQENSALTYWLGSSFHSRHQYLNLPVCFPPWLW